MSNIETKNIWLYNTKGRKKQLFTPLVEGKVGIYTCGPTVYGRAHLGNLRTYIFADTLRRAFEYAGFQPQHVMNITDVGHLTSDADEGDDKLMIGAKRELTTAWVIAKRYETIFFEDCAKLQILRPHVVCRATDHIPEQIKMIESLFAGGYCYTTSDGVYFDSSLFPKYGELANLDIDGLRAGERVSLGEKRNKTDFALWKFSPADSTRDMEWESPWGKGFPGWHIECSAMATHYLGATLDIHTGGADHIPIHHTNEIAQSECANHTSPFVNYWMHSQFLVFPSGERVAKSSGRALLVDALEDAGFDPLAYRYLCLSAHYRSFLNYTEDAIKSAAQGLSRLRGLARGLGYSSLMPQDDPLLGNMTVRKRIETIIAPLLDDLNTPMMLAGVWETLKSDAFSINEKLALIGIVDHITGLDLSRDEKTIAIDIPEHIMQLASLRNEARANKDWAKADAIRTQIDAAGYILEDASPHTSIIKRNC